MHLGHCSWLVQICVCWSSKSVFVEVPSLRGWLFSLCSLCACVLSLLNAVSSSQPVDQTCQLCDPNILCPNFPHTFSLSVIKRTVFKSSSISGVALSVSPYSSVCKCSPCQKTLSSFQGVSFTFTWMPSVSNILLWSSFLSAVNKPLLSFGSYLSAMCFTFPLLLPFLCSCKWISAFCGWCFKFHPVFF